MVQIHYCPVLGNDKGGRFQIKLFFETLSFFVNFFFIPFVFLLFFFVFRFSCDVLFLLLFLFAFFLSRRTHLPYLGGFCKTLESLLVDAFLAGCSLLHYREVIGSAGHDHGDDHGLL